MARDFELEQPPVPNENPAGRPDTQPPDQDPADIGPDQIDKKYWEMCLADAERAEQEWRSRGREIIKLYRNDGASTAQGRKNKLNAGQTFNILYSNTEVMQPAVYGKPPQPVVRSRFVRKSVPAPPPPPSPMPMGMGAPPMDPAMGGPPPQSGMGGGGLPPQPPMPGAPSVSPPGSPALPGQVPMPAAPAPTGNPLGIDINVTGLQQAAPLPEPPPPPEPGPPQLPPMMAAPMPLGMPDQDDIETAAAVMEKALEIVLDDDTSHEAVKSAVKDVLLPGRGLCRVRWKPVVETKSLEDPVMGGDLSLPDGTPVTEDNKVWETVNDEYVYWEDVLFDPVRQFADGSWVAFRHLFDEKSLVAEFPDSEQLQRIQAAGKVHELCRWTEESAAKNAVGGGGALKTADKLGDVIKKAMVWEIWDKSNRKVLWFIRETHGLVLRVDEDTLQLSNFFPCPRPLLAVTTTDTMLPRPYYDLYANLALDLEETSQRISRLTEKIKVRGGYNSASRDIADILTAGDGKMVPVVGVDMLSGGLQNHIWIVPIVEWVNALKELYLAREQIKQAIYEVMGISDLMRGATNPHETATAQRIKGTMGLGRLEDQKQNVASFIRELLRMKAEIISKNFDAETLTVMTGENVTPEVFAILRSDFSRTCSIDIETDSTVELDETMEQESNGKILMATQGIMQGAQGLLMTGVLPPPMIMQFTLELMKMMLHPIRGSRGVVELIDGFQTQLEAMAMAPPAPPMPGPSPGAGMPPGGPGPLPGQPPGGSPMNGGAPPPPGVPMQ